MRFFSNKARYILLYSLIGLFVGGGVAHASVVYYLPTENTTTAVGSCTYISEGTFIGDGSTLTTSSQVAFKGSKSDGLDTSFFISTISNMPDGVTNGNVVLYFPSTAGYASGYWNNTATLLNGTTYYILVFACNGTTPVLTGDNSGGVGFEITGEINTGATTIFDTSTRIISTVPTYAQVIATTSQTSIGLPEAQYIGDPNGVPQFCQTTDCSNGKGLATTTLNWTGYVATSTYVASSTYLVATINPSQTGFTGVSTYRYPITSAGNFSISTTSAIIYGGGDKMDSKIVIRAGLGRGCGDSFIDFFFPCLMQDSVVTSTSTIFQVGGTALSASDAHYLAILGTTEGLIEAAKRTSSTTEMLLKSCNPLSGFNMADCVKGLIVPTDEDSKAEVEHLREFFTSKAPIGWLSRMNDIIQATTTTALPVLSYTFQSDSPLSGDTLAFDTGAYMQQAAALSGEMVSNTDHKTAWEIFGGLIDMFLYIVLAFGIIHDLSGIRLINHRK